MLSRSPTIRASVDFRAGCNRKQQSRVRKGLLLCECTELHPHGLYAWRLPQATKDRFAAEHFGIVTNRKWPGCRPIPTIPPRRTGRNSVLLVASGGFAAANPKDYNPARELVRMNDGTQRGVDNDRVVMIGFALSALLLGPIAAFGQDVAFKTISLWRTPVYSSCRHPPGGSAIPCHSFMERVGSLLQFFRFSIGRSA